MVVFTAACKRDVVCSTAMIDGCVQNGRCRVALDLFRETQKEKVWPNEVTVVFVFSAYAQLGALELGRWIHSYIDKYRIRRNAFVGSVLVYMYKVRSKESV